ncbi:MAG: ECF-type sigma factor [Acidobacteriota bacterium]
MVAETNKDLTELLRRGSEGDRAAANEAFEALYGNLRRNAGAIMRRHSPGPQTLDTDGVVNEAYLKVTANGKSDWENRGHFMAVMSTAMRQVLLDAAKKKRRERHGGHLNRVDLSGILFQLEDRSLDLDEVHEALAAIRKDYEKSARVLELTYFVGLTAKESAEALEISESTIVRELKFARTLLRDELRR